MHLPLREEERPGLQTDPQGISGPRGGGSPRGNLPAAHSSTREHPIPFARIAWSRSSRVLWHSRCKRNLFNGGSKCCRPTHRFDHNVRTTPLRQFHQTIMHRLPLAVNRVSAACSACKFQLFVVHVDADRPRTARTRSSYGAQTHSATTHHCDSVVG